MRDGVIEAVGTADAVAVPYDAETIDGKGLFVYPGFLDLYTTIGQPQAGRASQDRRGRTLPYADFAFPRTPPTTATGSPPSTRSQRSSTSLTRWPRSAASRGSPRWSPPRRGPSPPGRVRFASLSGLPRREAVLKAPVALHIALRSPGGFAFVESQACADDDPHAVEALAALQAMATQDPAPSTPPSPVPTTPPGAPARPVAGPDQPGTPTRRPPHPPTSRAAGVAVVVEARSGIRPR